ncbi:hypothetical protein UFOVP75_37 [uncultured Caudovirales phage]|uniref:Uncharacterized protein n=1 Tax=uncultured Caudovirales phage TaxID=2100421 RepID=A0A6J5KZX7_9CAUD|nr:hypothetical protein UFOVP75_37 [uncultured Caudovirales phage]
MTEKIVCPTIHLNGTSPDNLLAPLREAISATRHAIAMLSECGPNGRDYYVQGSEAIYVATRQHNERLASLLCTQNELRTIEQSICDQVEQRSKR